MTLAMQVSLCSLPGLLCYPLILGIARGARRVSLSGIAKFYHGYLAMLVTW